MNTKITPVVLGANDDGGTDVKVSVEHNGRGDSEIMARAQLTTLKINLEDAGYTAVRGKATGSFRPDGDGDKTIESSDRGRVYSLRLTTPNADLTQEQFANDVRAALQGNTAREPRAAGAGRGS